VNVLEGCISVTFEGKPQMIQWLRRAAEATGRKRLNCIPTASVLILGVALLTGCGKAPAAGGPPPAMPVSVVQIEASDVPVSNEWVGTLDGYVNAQIQPQANGYLIKQNYREGAQVAKGQILFEIDPRPFQAALDQAKGQLAQAQTRQRCSAESANRGLRAVGKGFCSCRGSCRRKR
jgi:multidrug efflux pump subunit AcrA (membrane-fusion protein)